VFQNALLTLACLDRLGSVGSGRARFRPLTHRLVPANDGGLALGQAYIAVHHPTTGHRAPVTGQARRPTIGHAEEI
jgi:hydrogenase maturation protein HypF